jgi:hypothetical protein
MYYVAEIVSIVIQTLIFVRIKYYKFKAMKQTGVEDESTTWKNVFLNKMANQSIASVSTAFITIAGIFIVAMLANRLNVMNQKQMFEKQSMVIIVYLGVPAMFAYSVVLMLYVHHKKLRKAVWTELKERFHF